MGFADFASGSADFDLGLADFGGENADFSKTGNGNGKIMPILRSAGCWNAENTADYADYVFYYVLERRRIFRFRTIALILRPIPIVYVFSSSVLILLSIITGMHVGVLPVCTSAFSTVCTQSNTYVWMDSCVVKNCVIPAITAEIPTFVWANLSMNKHKLNAD